MTNAPDNRELFEAWARRKVEAYRDRQWLLSKWEVDEGIAWSDRKVRLMIRHILDGLDLSPQDRWADLGCGGGWIWAALLRRAPWGAGVDFSRTMLACARRTAGSDRAVCADLRALPFVSGCFDRVLSYFVFINLSEIQAERAVGEMIRVLRPGGRALIGQVPDAAGSGEYDREKASYLADRRGDGNSGADDLRRTCRPPLFVYDRAYFREGGARWGVEVRLRDAFNPFYREGQPETVSWRFDVILQKAAGGGKG